MFKVNKIVYATEHQNGESIEKNRPAIIVDVMIDGRNVGA